MRKHSQNYDTTEINDVKIAFPKKYSNWVKYGKVGAYIFGGASSVFAIFMAIYAIPNQVYINTGKLEKIETQHGAISDKVDALESYRDKNTAAISALDSLINDINSRKKEEEICLKELSRVLTKTATAVEFIEKNVAEVKSELKEFRHEQAMLHSDMSTAPVNLSTNLAKAIGIK